MSTTRSGRASTRRSNSDSRLATLAAALLLVASTAARAGTTHYVDFINTADSSVTSLQVAAAGSDQFRAIRLGSAPLQGGGALMTFAVGNDAAGCLHDLRIGFADGRVLTHHAFDVCKYRSYHTGLYLRRQAPLLQVAQT